MDEISRFMNVWQQESAKTINLLKSLPCDQYQLPTPMPMAGLWASSLGTSPKATRTSRSVSSEGQFDFDGVKPAGIERPRKVELLAPAYERILRDAVERVKKLTPDDLDRSIPFFAVGPVPVRDLLWSFVVMHNIHHRGQLVLMCRLAGGTPTGVFGPTREEMVAMKAAAAAQ